jgi:hypothetical protein
MQNRKSSIKNMEQGMVDGMAGHDGGSAECEESRAPGQNVHARESGGLSQLITTVTDCGQLKTLQ